MRKSFLAVLALALVLVGLTAIPASATPITNAPIQGTHTVTGTCPTNGGSVDYNFTITGDSFQMNSATYHGSGQNASPYSRVDGFLSPTGGGAGGASVRPFAAHVTNNTVATKTSNWTGNTWGAIQLSSTIGSQGLNYNYLYSGFGEGAACEQKFNLSTWATYPNEPQPPVTGSWTATVDCYEAAPSTRVAHWSIPYTVSGGPSTYTLTVGSITQSGDATSSHQIDLDVPFSVGVLIGHTVSGGSPNETSISVPWNSAWPDPYFNGWANFLSGGNQCQSNSPGVQGGW